MNEITRRGFLQGMLALTGLAATDLPLMAQPMPELLEASPGTVARDTLGKPCVWYGDLRIPVFDMSVSFQQEAIDRGGYMGQFLKGLASWGATVYSREMPKEFPELEQRHVVMGMPGADFVLEGMGHLESCSTERVADDLMFVRYEFTGHMPFEMKMR